jgi:hypothetical protein
VDNSYLDLGVNKSGFVYTLPSGRLTDDGSKWSTFLKKKIRHACIHIFIERNVSFGLRYIHDQIKKDYYLFDSEKLLHSFLCHEKDFVSYLKPT